MPHAIDVEPEITKGPDLAKTTILIKLEAHSFWNSRKMKDDQYEPIEGINKDDTNANRKLLQSPELDEINRIVGQARSYLASQALDFPIDTIYMIPRKKLLKVAAKLKEFKGLFEPAVQVFVSKYPDRKREAKARNPKGYDPTEYPAESEVHKKFGLSYQCVSIGVPERELEEIDPELLEESIRAREQMWREAMELSRTMQVDVMRQLVGHLREKLEDDGTGKPKKFRDTTVTKLNDFLQEFQESMNVTEFSELDKLVKKARGVLSGTTPDDLRENDDVRETIRAEMQKIERQLVPLVGERKVRKSGEF